MSIKNVSFVYMKPNPIQLNLFGNKIYIKIIKLYL